MTRLLDITHDVCPMTTVKVGMAMARLAPAEELTVMVREEALRNVVASLKVDGHRIDSIGRQEAFYLLHVEKDGANASESAAYERLSAPEGCKEEMQP
jgi:TusA-related sulfurtransferase